MFDTLAAETAPSLSLTDRSKQFILNLSIDAGLSALCTAIVDQAIPGGLGPDSVIFGTMIGKATAEFSRWFLESEGKPENLPQLLRRSAAMGLLAGAGYLGIDLLAQNPIDLPSLASLFSSPETASLATNAATGVQEAAPQVVGQVTIESPITLADAIATGKDALPYLAGGSSIIFGLTGTALIGKEVVKVARTLPDHARAWWQAKIDWKNQKLAQVGEKVITVSEFLQEHGQKLAALAPELALAAPPIPELRVTISDEIGPAHTVVEPNHPNRKLLRTGDEGYFQITPPIQSGSTPNK